MNKKRLLKLADYLENYVEDKSFNLSMWANSEGIEKVKKGKKTLMSCGTAGCALGHATDCFKNLKLAMEFAWSGPYLTVKHTKTGSTDYLAAQEFFGINENDSYFLFNPWEYPDSHKSRKYVAKRIRRFVETNGESSRNKDN